MFKTFLCLYTFGALLVGVQSDYKCFLSHIQSTGLGGGIGIMNLAICDDLPEKYIALENLKRQCSFDVDIEGVKLKMAELCDPDSELNEKMEDASDCYLEHLPYHGECKQTSMIPVKTYEQCKRVFQGQLDCYIYRAGKPCGEAAINYIKAMAQLTEALLRGICPEMEELSASTSSFANTHPGILLAIFLAWCVEFPFLRMIYDT